MSLWKREHSPARSAASRTNGARSRGPQTPQGKAIALRNPLKGTGESEVMESSLAALGESREESEKKHQALAEAMQPRDAWEAAWVRDIAALRWRLERLQRAEAGVVALQRRRCDRGRQRAAFPPTGSRAISMSSSISLLGFAGITDSTEKFH